MGRLLKYELKKTGSLNLIMLAILGVLEVLFLIMINLDQENGMFLTFFLIFLCLFVFLIVVGLEGIVTYFRELKTRRSYMMFLTPNSAYKIMGAKLIATLIWLVIFAVITYIVVALDVIAIYGKYEGLEYVIERISEILSILTKLDISFASLLASFVDTVVNGIMILTIAFFAITLSSTFLINNRANGFISFILFIAVSVVIGTISSSLFDRETMNYMAYTGAHIAYDAAFAILAFCLTGRLLEKKIDL